MHVLVGLSVLSLCACRRRTRAVLLLYRQEERNSILDPDKDMR